MIKCICVDDEPLALRLMEDYIGKISFLEPIAFCEDGIEANIILHSHQIDLVFLDIQMPGLTGLQLIKSFPYKPMFILVTAYEAFALEGYRLDVIDYLLKPVNFQYFLQAVNKAKALFELQQNRSALEQKDDYFFVNLDYGLVRVVIDDIIWVEGLRDYIKIHFRDAKPLMIRMSMKAIEEKLSGTKLIRIHKSYIVAISHITSIRGNSLFLGTRELPIGDAYKVNVDAITGRT
jgi:two-component system LytT family response regulator